MLKQKGLNPLLRIGNIEINFNTILICLLGLFVYKIHCKNKIIENFTTSDLDISAINHLADVAKKLVSDGGDTITIPGNLTIDGTIKSKRLEVNGTGADIQGGFALSNKTGEQSIVMNPDNGEMIFNKSIETKENVIIKNNLQIDKKLIVNNGADIKGQLLCQNTSGENILIIGGNTVNINGTLNNKGTFTVKKNDGTDILKVNGGGGDGKTNVNKVLNVGNTSNTNVPLNIIGSSNTSLIDFYTNNNGSHSKKGNVGFTTNSLKPAVSARDTSFGNHWSGYIPLYHYRIVDGYDDGSPFNTSNLDQCARTCSTKGRAVAALRDRNNGTCWCKTTTGLRTTGHHSGHETAIFR